MNLDQYIERQYGGDPLWFKSEVNQGYHAKRISDTINSRDYLLGRHKVLNREDSQYKGKTLMVRKTILNYAKTVIKFHNTFLLGKPVQLSCKDENTANILGEVYRQGMYSTVDYELLDRVNKFGEAFEAIYIEDGTIRSKVLDNASCYPVYDDMGNYVSFIEHWTDVFTGISYYNVYYPDFVEHWSNEGGEEYLVSSDRSVGLPIHYHNFSDEDYNTGSSILNDMIPILDELEDVLSKLGDAIYVNSLNPMPVAIGQRIESSIPADATGYVLNLDVGDFKYASCNIDHNTVKLYLDNLKQFLADVGCMPSVLGSNTNIANISETSMKILLMLATVNAEENKKWLNIGFRERFRRFKKIFSMQGIEIDDDVDVIYNISMPTSDSDIVSNLKALQEMGAISRETIMEKTEYVTDTEVEKDRLRLEEEML